MSTRKKNGQIVRRSDAGFTLLSLSVAIMLLSVGLLSISQLLTQSASMQTQISLRKSALDVARSYLEEVKIRDALTLASEGEVRVNEVGEEALTGRFTRSLTVESVSTHMMLVRVTVTSPRASPVEIVTYIWDGVY